MPVMYREVKSGRVVSQVQNQFEDRFDTDTGIMLQHWKIAQLLSGYDDLTWNKLRKDRRATYLRAAQVLTFNYHPILKEVIKLERK